MMDAICRLQAAALVGLALALLSGCMGDGAFTAAQFERDFNARRTLPYVVGEELGEQRAADRGIANVHADSLERLRSRLAYPEGGVFDRKEAVTLDLRGVTLGEALKLVADAGGINLVFQGTFIDPVDAVFKDVSLDEAFRSLLENYRCSLHRSGGMWTVARWSPSEPVQHIFTLQSLSPEDVSAAVQSILKAESAPVTGPDGGSIVVTASFDALVRAAEYLDSVDRPERQVVIEARIVEMVLSDLLELGTDLNFRNIHIDDTTSQILSNFLPAVTPSATLTFAGDKAAIDGSLRILKELTRLEILSRPQIVAKNGQEAKIEVIQEVPYIQATTTTTGTTDGVGTATVEEVEFKEVGIKLTVTPFIKGDESVELKIVQDDSVQTDTFLDVPVVDRRLIDTRLVVRNGETVVIGGLIKTVVSNEVSGIPFLMDIPILGHLFKLTRDRKEKRELMVLISPTVVDAGPAGLLEITTLQEQGGSGGT